MSTEIVFIENIKGNVDWIIYPDFFAGNKLGKYEATPYDVLIKLDFTNGEVGGTSVLRTARSILHLLQRGIVVYFEYENDDFAGHLICTCVLVLQNSKCDTKLREKVASSFSKLRSIRGRTVVREYTGRELIIAESAIRVLSKSEPVKRVIICGCRHSSAAFEHLITQELKKLPRGSTIIHGGCKGVDETAGKMAEILNKQDYKRFNILVMPVTKEMWESQGKSAGPSRNQKMLEQHVDYVLAFHPDIDLSKGTKDMIMRAWKAGKPVYVYDLKRKSKFEGDFSKL